jgi:hypothetical protein
MDKGEFGRYPPSIKSPILATLGAAALCHVMPITKIHFLSLQCDPAKFPFWGGVVMANRCGRCLTILDYIAISVLIVSALLAANWWLEQHKR